MRQTMCIAAGLLSLGAASALPGELAPSEFLRLIDLGEGKTRLETAIVSFEREDGLSVALVAAVHFADLGYYHKLEWLLDTYAAVLYEGLGAEAPEAASGDGGFDIALLLPLARETLDWAMEEAVFQGLLGLASQSVLDTGKENFIHADMSLWDFLRRIQGESAETFQLVYLSRRLKPAKEGGPSLMGGLVEVLRGQCSRKAWKRFLARELILAGVFVNEVSAKDRWLAVAVHERNSLVELAIEKQLRPGRRLAVFYGAAHMPGLEKYLIERLGLRKARTEWVTAWRIGEKNNTGPEVLVARAKKLLTRGRYAEARAAFAEASVVLERLVNAEGEVYLTPLLAESLSSGAMTLDYLERHEEASADHDVAIDLLSKLPARDGLRLLVTKGVCFWRRARCRDMRGSGPLALDDYTTAIDLLDRALEVKGEFETALLLAQALSHRARLLESQASLTEALKDLDRGTAIYRRHLWTLQVRGEGSELAVALTLRGVVLARLDRHAETLKDLAESIQLFESVRAKGKDGEYTGWLDSARRWREFVESDEEGRDRD